MQKEIEKELDKLAPSKRSAAKTMFATFKILKESGGQLHGKQVIEKIRNSIELTDWEKKFTRKQDMCVGNLFYIFTQLIA